MRTAAPVPFVAGLVRSLRTLIHGLLFDAGFMHQPTPKHIHLLRQRGGGGGGLQGQAIHDIFHTIRLMFGSQVAWW